MKFLILALLPAVVLAHGGLVGGGRGTRVEPRSGKRLGAATDPKPLPVQASGSADNASLFKALLFATCVVSDQVNSAFLYVPGDISGSTYTEQVTAGMTYRFYDVPLEMTTCPKPDKRDCAGLDLNAFSCDAGFNEGKAGQCDFVVQFQAWMDPAFTLTNFTCSWSFH